jgi:hypothetical protein
MFVGSITYKGSFTARVTREGTEERLSDLVSDYVL